MSAQSYGDEQAAITGWIKSQWVETPLALPNVRLEHDGAAHVEVRINRQTAFNASVAASQKLVRHPGLLTLRIRVPVGVGDGPSGVDYADELCALVRNQTIDGVHFRAPTMRDRGRGTGADEAWYVIDVDCPYYRDTVFD